MEESAVNSLADIIRENAFSAHTYFKNGFLEKVYENSLRNRLRKAGLKVEQQIPIPVIDEDGSVVGDYVADLIVEDTLLIELKAIKALSDEHTAQILAYLKTTQLKHGMLINFGSQKIQIRKFIL